MQSLYFIYLGIGTYDYILEKRELSELKEKLQTGEIDKSKYNELKKQMIEKRKIDLNDRRKSRIIYKKLKADMVNTYK